MAVQSQSQGQLQDFLAILKKRVGQVFLPAILVGSLGVMIAVLMPKKYTVATVLELHETTLPLGGDGTTIQRDVASAQWHIRSMERIRRVIEKLEWPDYTALPPQEQYEYLQRVVKNLNVGVQGPGAGRNMQGSSFITISFSDSDGERAEQFLNRLRDAYTAEVVERYRNNVRATRDSYQNDLLEAERTYREKENQLAELKKQHGLSATQIAPGRGQREEDPVFNRMNQEKVKLADLTTQIVGNKAKLETLRKQFDAEPKEVPETTLSGGVSFDEKIQEIENDIADQKLLRVGLKPLHSIYQAAEARIVKLEAMKQSLLEHATRPQSEVRLVANPKREALKTEIDKTELLIQTAEGTKKQVEAAVIELERQHTELAEVYREISLVEQQVLNARAVYDARHLRFQDQRTRVELVMRPEINPFEVTEVAQAPRKPTSPNVPALIVFGVLAGLGIGLASALIGEFGRGAFRSVGDVARSMTVPVLGAVNSIVTRAEARRALTRRAMIASSTLILAGAILWVTWAYENRPRLLGSHLTGLIDDVRSKFR